MSLRAPPPRPRAPEPRALNYTIPGMSAPLDHLARPLHIHHHHARRQAHRHRPVAGGQSGVPGRSQADRPGRPDPAVARPLRPLRRRGQRRARDRRAGGRRARAVDLAAAEGAAERARDGDRRDGDGRRARGQRWCPPSTPAASSRTTRSSIWASRPASWCGWRIGRAFYFAGDTALFGDMRLIGEMHAAGDRVPADRRPLHDGTRSRGPRLRRCSASARSCRCTTARSRC